MSESLPAVHDDGARATSVGLVDFSEMVREKKVEAKLDQSSSAFFKSRARRQSYDTDRTFKKFFWRETRLPLGAACTIFMTMQFLSSVPNLVNNCKSLKMSAETPTTVFVVFHLDVFLQFWFCNQSEVNFLQSAFSCHAMRLQTIATFHYEQQFHSSFFFLAEICPSVLLLFPAKDSIYKVLFMHQEPNQRPLVCEACALLLCYNHCSWTNILRGLEGHS